MKPFAVFVLASCYLLVLAGSTVRATGSGLGCPDWPTCFGRVVPPTHVSELPPDYREAFAVDGRPVAEFDAFKTWVEYANRLLGVFVGIEMIALVVAAWILKGPLVLSLAALVLTCIQGGVGALVVSSHLNPSLVSLHVVLALAILFILHALCARLSPGAPSRTRRGGGPLALPVLALLAASLVQLLLGTGVRGMVDPMMNAAFPPARESWVDGLGAVFLAHRIGAAAVVLGFALLAVRAVALGRRDVYGRIIAAGTLLALSASSGAALAGFAFPAVLQPVHLTAACLYLGTLFSLWLGERKLPTAS